MNKNNKKLTRVRCVYKGSEGLTEIDIDLESFLEKVNQLKDYQLIDTKQYKRITRSIREIGISFIHIGILWDEMDIRYETDFVHVK